MTIALAQQATPVGATSGTSATPTLGSTPGTSSLLVLTQIGNAGRVSAVSGYGVTTWAVAKQSVFGNYAADIWYGIVDTTPATTGTVTLGASTYHAITLSEWTGIDAAAPLLAQSDADDATSTSASTGPITASDGPCLYVSVLAISGGTTASSPSGSFTGLTVGGSTPPSSGTMKNYTGYRIDDPTPSSATSGWTVSSSVQWSMSIAAFKGLVATGSSAAYGAMPALASLRGLSR